MRTRLVLCFALLAALLTGCASAPPAPTSTSAGVPVSAQARVRSDVAVYALSLLQQSYRYGGKGPAKGFDCSGLVQHVYAQGAGLRVQGTAAQIGQQARPIDTAALQPGDLVFFNTLGARHSHVGVYVGDGRFVHASNPRTGVRIDALNNRYYASRFEGGASLLD